MRREELLTQLAQDQLSLDSALFRSCRSYLKAVTLFDHGTATEQATTLLTEFQQASEQYSQLAELGAYLDQNDFLSEDIGRRGDQFRSWLQRRGTITYGSGMTLDYVAHELGPLPISGVDFQWDWNSVDGHTFTESVSQELRRSSVDLLLRFDGRPVWTEVKMRGDTWTSSAMQQILFYGSILSSGNQKRRCRHYFPDHFQSFQPWLGILVEDRDAPKFVADYEQTLNFANSQNTKSTLKDLFGGIVFGIIQETPNGWVLSRSQIIRW